LSEKIDAVDLRFLKIKRKLEGKKSADKGIEVQIMGRI
jgi:hypothetical protein